MGPVHAGGGHIPSNPARKTPQNEKFVADFKAKTGHIPTEAAGMNYYRMWVLKEALELSGSCSPKIH